MVRQGYVYIMASQRNGTLYVGVTNDIARRVHEHREGVLAGFTRQYGVKMLVWYEAHGDVPTAIGREKAIKAWQRAWKLRLIEAANPEWNDLWPTLFGEGLGVEDWLRLNFPDSVVPV
ncbi:endonuclease [Polymorphobacter glacialis]|uniref:Endonuclease n=1 Tax=Sandarakinorhabdus glacialis TaxID=1614636 RepID=A0A916ZW62_9SPHN|nr:GIY-YIG nuclease family protein [Polymorphobacter glacialis]GGE16468.1 endonuclease [Polymorphobacter glacialis]